MMKYTQYNEMMGTETLLAGTNTDGENVVLQRFPDEGDGPYIRVTTSQNNGWLMIHDYYRDGTVVETFDR